MRAMSEGDLQQLCITMKSAILGKIKCAVDKIPVGMQMNWRARREERHGQMHAHTRTHAHMHMIGAH